MEKYAALIVDIEKSRKYGLRERNEIQEYLSEYIIRLNDVFKSGLECQVTFSGGDEIQGLFVDPVVAIMYFRLLEILMKPIKLRAGIGIGEWTVRREDGLSTQQDGPVYHKAREAIDEVYKSQFQSIRIVSEDEDVLVNHLINTSYVLKGQQVDMQNLVQVMIELIYPFVTPKMNMRDLSRIDELIELKCQYGPKSFSVAGRESGILMEREMYIGERIEINPIVIDGVIRDGEKILLKRNMASNLAKMLGCTRQNADSIIRRGNINKIRELDYMALQYMEQKYGGDYDTDSFRTYFR